MKLGIGSYTFPFGASSGQLSHFELLDKAVNLGAEVVQFCENLSLTCLSTGELADLIDQAREAGIALEVGTRGLDLSNMARHAELARKVGSGFVRVVAHGGSADQSAADIERHLQSCLGVCEGVAIAIENHDRLAAVELLRIVESLGPDKLGITLDTANSLGCLEGTNEVADRLGLYARCLHIKDVKATRLPLNLGFMVVGTPAGEGDVDIPRILGRMTPQCASAILEQWPPHPPGTPAPIELENRWAAEGLDYLRGLIRA